MSVPENSADQQSANIARAGGGALPTYGSGAATAATGQGSAVASILLSLPWPVSANRYWSTAIIKGRAVTFVSKEAKVYKQSVGFLARSAGLREPIKGRIALTVRLFPPRPKDWARRAAKNPDTWDDDVRSIDLDNALKVTLDALKDIAFEDDRWVRQIHAERLEPDAHGARVEVEIRPLLRESIAPELTL